MFASFETEPLASGSVAQVHRATLQDGTKVVVKVIHRHVRRRVLEDLELLGALAVWAEAVSPAAHRLRFAGVAADFDHSMRGAVDLREELANLQRFGAIFADDDGVRIPAAYPEQSAAGVLTMEEMTGHVLEDADSVRAAGWTPDDLASRTASIYLTMMFEHGIYHTDPHPGNFLLEPGVITILDFGDVARLPTSKRRQLEDLVASVGSGDPRAVTDALLEITDAPAGTDEEAVQNDVESFITDHLDGDIGSLDLGVLSRGLAAVVQRHGLSLPGEIALVLRVITLLQGLAATIGADIDLPSITKPFTLDLVKRRPRPEGGRRARPPHRPRVGAPRRDAAGRAVRDPPADPAGGRRRPAPPRPGRHRRPHRRRPPDGRVRAVGRRARLPRRPAEARVDLGAGDRGRSRRAAALPRAAHPSRRRHLRAVPPAPGRAGDPLGAQARPGVTSPRSPSRRTPRPPERRVPGSPTDRVGPGPIRSDGPFRRPRRERSTV